MNDKTADEMFKDLDYYRDYPMESNGTIRYQKKFGPHIVWYLDSGEVEKVNDTFYEQSWSVEEILAFAKLVEEIKQEDYSVYLPL